MISREDLLKAAPNVETATIRFVRGEITRAEYESLVEQERMQDQRPAGEQTASAETHG